jgi:sulfite reductase alpha subunit
MWDFWMEHGKNRERLGELIQRLGMREFLKAVGLKPDPRMINTPRYNPYIFYDPAEVPGGWSRDAKAYRERHQP